MSETEKFKRKVISKAAALLLAVTLLLTGTLPAFTSRAGATVLNPSSEPLYQQSTGSAAVLSATITADDNFTYLMITSTQMLTFSFHWTRTAVGINIHGANSFPGAVHMHTNPLFTSAHWSGSTINLTLTGPDRFLGYHGYYDSSGNLIIRFRNPPSSMSVARIVIDPGHGGRDRGAEGFNRDLPESVVNQQMARFLADELRARGATVLVLDTFTHGMELSERVRQAEQFNADFLISVHNNASRNPAATGTEAFFFTPFSNVLAGTISREVSRQLGTENRRGRRARFVITRSPQFASVLVEAGFMTNRAEYEKLINPQYQQAVAVGISDAIDIIIHHTYPGTGRLFRTG